jgi:5-oxopent-3-ene-1,2,5-tricarboxylate decarboxylase/2-hydroxyhepta-2,4-diene-1,7-dioate isomerase
MRSFANPIGRLENAVMQSEVELVPVGERPAVTARTLHVALTIPEVQAEREVQATR